MTDDGHRMTQEERVLPPIYTAVMRRLQAAPIVIDISACNH
jgi:hypothetical protein